MCRMGFAADWPHATNGAAEGTQRPVAAPNGTRADRAAECMCPRQLLELAPVRAQCPHHQGHESHEQSDSDPQRPPPASFVFRPRCSWVSAHGMIVGACIRVAGALADPDRVAPRAGVQRAGEIARGHRRLFTYVCGMHHQRPTTTSTTAHQRPRAGESAHGSVHAAHPSDLRRRGLSMSWFMATMCPDRTGAMGCR